MPEYKRLKTEVAPPAAPHGEERILQRQERLAMMLICMATCYGAHGLAGSLTRLWTGEDTLDLDDFRKMAPPDPG